MVFSPHSTHTLQPLDVAMFSPLSRDHSAELSRHLHCSQGLIAVNKSDFFPLFWIAYTASFTYKNICKAFEATGIVPANADVILNRFTSSPSDGNTDSEVGQHGDGDSWKELHNLLDVAVRDKSSVEVKRISTALHSLQVNNELVHYQNKGLRTTIATKKRHQRKGKPLDLQ
jgi:hypothetical protein